MRAQFNADEETSDRPELTLGGKTYTGRVLSIVEWFSFKERFAALDAAPKVDGQQTPETLDASGALAIEFLRAVFPVQGTADPISDLQARGFLAVTKAFSAFFYHQLYALGMVPPQLPPKTNGTDSPNKTTDESSANESDSETS